MATANSAGYYCSQRSDSEEDCVDSSKEESGVESAAFDYLLKNSDFVSYMLPLLQRAGICWEWSSLRIGIKADEKSER